MAVGGGEDASRNRSRMIVTGLFWDLVSKQPARGLEIEHRDLRGEQRRLNALALAGLLAFEQSNEDAHRAEDAGREIRDGDTRADGALAGESRNGHQAAHALRDLVEAGAIGIGAVLAEAGNARVDEARVERAQIRIADAEAVFDVGTIVLDKDVSGGNEAFKDFDALGAFEVQGHAALVAMEILEIETVARANFKSGIR